MEMENTATAAIEDESAHEFDSTIKSIWRVFWILLAVTVLEVSLATVHYLYHVPPRMLMNVIFLSLTLVKAFFIVAEFMHLRHEVKNLILSILIPLTLFVWFITAFLADGNSWKNLKADSSHRIEMVDPGMSAKRAG
jgi:cytochrome c oxidase subunit IV